MSVGEVRPASRRELPCDLRGARRWRFDVGEGNSYIPYFYNPPLDPAARRMIAVGEAGGCEQIFLLDLRHDTATRLTAATGSEQNWSPYIRENVCGIRPQFICWSLPDWEHVLYWENNRLRRVNVATGVDAALFELADDRAPAVPHCSAGGWVSWGYLPAAQQGRLQRGASVPDLEGELAEGCGICVYDLAAGELVLDLKTPFWPNHVAASPDHRWVLYCHEGAWTEQRMYLYDIARGESRPLRPQDDGARIGHEFWIDATTVGYHGARDGRGFFGTIDVETGECTERPSPVSGNEHYGHYHVSPDGRAIVTDGEIASDAISLSPLGGDVLDFQPVCRHDWAREQDQRHHPHPHWHQGGRFITFTGTERRPDGAVRTYPCLLELPEAR
jgi:hypothetical protein